MAHDHPLAPLRRLKSRAEAAWVRLIWNKPGTGAKLACGIGVPVPT
jgi:hypothetical protein